MYNIIHIEVRRGNEKMKREQNIEQNISAEWFNHSYMRILVAGEEEETEEDTMSDTRVAIDKKETKDYECL